MRAMMLERSQSQLALRQIPVPIPLANEVLIKIEACGVCRTDLHILDGDLRHPKLPLVLGHEVVGVVESVGEKVSRFRPQDRVGVPWLHETCGHCLECRAKRQNLCENARFTGYDVDGGFAEYCKANEEACYLLPPRYSSFEAAPLMCAGLIGYRAYKMVRESERIGIYGFGAAAHIIAQVAILEGKEVLAFTRSGDVPTQQFAKHLGAVFAGASDFDSPLPLDAAIIFAPVGALVPVALRNVRKGGTVVCAGIHMSDIPSFPYDLLWGERVVRSVANLTREDGEEFLHLAEELPIQPAVTTFPLSEANHAIEQLRKGRVQGAAVLVP